MLMINLPQLLILSMVKRSVKRLITTYRSFRKLGFFRQTRQAYFALLLALSMALAVLTPLVSYSQTTISDIQGHWAQSCIEQLVQKQIIPGNENGSFSPNSPVNRAEFALIISKAFPNQPVVRNAVRFADIPSNYGARDAIRKAYQTGFLSAYLGEIFNPLRPITREQVLQSLVTGLKYSPTQPVDQTLTTVFDDAQEIPKNSRTAIAAATEKLLIVNYPNVRQLKPNQNVTRGEVAAFLCQAMGTSQLIPNQYIAQINPQTTATTAARTQTPPTTPARTETSSTNRETKPNPSATSITTPPRQTTPARTETSPTNAEIKPNPSATAITTPPKQTTPARTETSSTNRETESTPSATSITTPARTETSSTNRETKPNPSPTTTAVIRNPNRIVREKPFEIRGVWLTNIDSDVLFDQNRLASAIARLKSLNFNTLYPTVWNWGYTLYPSKVAERVVGNPLRLVTPIDEDLDPNLGTDRDVLQEIVTQGHQKGMAVIPWFEFGFMTAADSELAKRHPEWILKRRDGSQIWIEGPHQRVWINPFRPEVQQFIENLVLEIVTNYDVDGIQFDDHFGFPSEFGYDEFTVALYQQEHDGQSPPNNFRDPEWIRWRADKISEYMQRIHQAIKQRKPKVVVSVSPNPQEFSYKFFLADWQRWQEQGLVEELVLQIYRNDLNRFIEEIERPEVEAARRRIPVAIGIMTGVKPQPIPMAQVREQVEVVRSWGFSGVSFFFYESLWNLAKEPSAQRQSALQTMFPTSMQRPNFFADWKPPI